METDDSLTVLSSWRADTNDGLLVDIRGEIVKTNQPGTFIYHNERYSLPCEYCQISQITY